MLRLYLKDEITNSPDLFPYAEHQFPARLYGFSVKEIQNLHLFNYGRASSYKGLFYRPSCDSSKERSYTQYDNRKHD